MNDKKSKSRIEGRLRYRRRLHNEKAVSPVVATLILILIAVAAAAALYLWLVGWQGGVTKAIGTPVIPSNDTFTLGGSTTVYPMSQIAIQWFEQNNTNVKIDDQQGGSVAGVEAWCAGQLDVAASSSSFTTSQLIGDGCSASQANAAVQTVVAVDGLVAIVSTKNTGIGVGAGLVPAAEVSFNASTLYGEYVAASTKVATTNTGTYYTGSSAQTTGPSGNYTLPSWLCGSVKVNATDTKYGTCPNETVSVGGGRGFTWSVIPFPAGCDVKFAFNATNGGCYWGTLNNNPTATYGRADSGGTSQGFTQKLLQIPKDGSQNSCGTDNQPLSCNIVQSHSEVGNSAVAAALAADPNGIGYCSYGQASSTPNVVIAGYQGTAIVGQSQQPAPILPTIPNVLGAYKGTVTGAAAYQPWRVLEYITNGAPSPGSIVANYENFVLGSEVNQNLGVLTGYISLYAA